jgi:hypothetical protein
MVAYLRDNGRIGAGTKIAVATDHFALAHAQRKLNGYGGIGRGRSLNRMYELTNSYDIAFFFVAGASNPADTISRNFGVTGKNGEIVEAPADDVVLPLLRMTFCPIAEADMRPNWMR